MRKLQERAALSASVARLKSVHKSFVDPGGSQVPVLCGIDLAVDTGSTHGVVGRSGSGKSTLLSILGLLDSADTGAYELAGVAVGAVGDRELSVMRGDLIGFVYQRFFLLGHLDAYQNVELALLHARRRPRRSSVMDALDQVGMASKGRRRPSQLSGGEQQRVAIARAMVTGPRLILADEPTGALDGETADEVLEILLSAVNDRGAALVAVTHDEVVAGRMQQRHVLVRGQWDEVE